MKESDALEDSGHHLSFPFLLIKKAETNSIEFAKVNKTLFRYMVERYTRDLETMKFIFDIRSISLSLGRHDML